LLPALIQAAGAFASSIISCDAFLDRSLACAPGSQLFLLEAFEPSMSRIERGLPKVFEVVRGLEGIGGRVGTFAAEVSVLKVGVEGAGFRGR